MKKVTIKEIKIFLKTLEENRYRKLVHADARRIAWFVNNSLSEDYDTMPESMRKKWVKAEYKKERYMAKKFLESKKQNEQLEEQIRHLVREGIRDLMEAKVVQLKIWKKDHDKARKLLKKIGLKDTKDFAFEALGLKGKAVGLQVKNDAYNDVLELFIKNNIKVRG